MNIHPTVHISEIIKAPIEKIWKFFRDFNGLPKFHPTIKHSKIIHGSPDTVGCVRYLTLDTGYVCEELLLLDDKNHALDYSIIDNDLGLTNYFANIRLHNNNSYTICEWSANFDVEDGIDKQTLIDVVSQNVFKTGLLALANKLAKESSLLYH